MVEHIDNQKKRGHAENKTTFYYIRYRQPNVSQTSALIFCLEIVAASKSPVEGFCKFIFMTDDNDTNKNDRRTKPIA